MTEMEKMAKGYLWGDTDEYLEEQRIARELAYSPLERIVSLRPMLRSLQPVILHIRSCGQRECTAFP